MLKAAASKLGVSREMLKSKFEQFGLNAQDFLNQEKTQDKKSPEKYKQKLNSELANLQQRLQTEFSKAGINQKFDDYLEKYTDIENLEPEEVVKKKKEIKDYIENERSDLSDKIAKIKKYLKQK